MATKRARIFRRRGELERKHREEKNREKRIKRDRLFRKIVKYRNPKTLQVSQTDDAIVGTKNKGRTTQVITLPQGKFERCSKYKPNEFEILAAKRKNTGLIEKKKSGCHKDTECE